LVTIIKAYLSISTDSSSKSILNGGLISVSNSKELGRSRINQTVDYLGGLGVQSANISLDKRGDKEDGIKDGLLGDDGAQCSGDLWGQDGNFSNDSLSIFSGDSGGGLTAASTSSIEFVLESRFLGLDNECTSITLISGVSINLFIFLFFLLGTNKYYYFLNKQVTTYTSSNNSKLLISGYKVIDAGLDIRSDGALIKSGSVGYRYFLVTM
jgi:hypothetical protein